KEYLGSRLEADLTLAPQGSGGLEGCLGSRLEADISTVPSIHLHNPMFMGNSGNVNGRTFNLSKESALKRIMIMKRYIEFWPKIYVGTSRFIYMIASGVNLAIIYKFEPNLRQQKYKVIGDVEGVDSIL
ncbi:18136_t:CDS:2, partial [Dentiscutata erythropus]